MTLIFAPKFSYHLVNGILSWYGTSDCAFLFAPLSATALYLSFAASSSEAGETIYLLIRFQPRFLWKDYKNRFNDSAISIFITFDFVCYEWVIVFLVHVG